MINTCVDQMKKVSLASNEESKESQG